MCSFIERTKGTGPLQSRLVDARLYVDRGHKRVTLEGETHQALADGTILPSHLFYANEAGAANWWNLAADETYASRRDSEALFHDQVGLMAVAIGYQLAPPLGLHLVGLGPGSGHKEHELFKRLRRLVDPDAPSSCGLYDISPDILSRALLRFGNGGIDHQTALTCIVASFAALPELSPLLTRPDSPRLFTLLGNTLGNLADDLGFLRLVRRQVMCPGDLLLLEVTVQQPETVALTSLGDPEVNKRFNFEPLRQLGVEFDPHRLVYSLCQNRSTIPGTRSIVARYENFAIGDVRYTSADLACTHRYDSPELIASAQTIGLTLVHAPWTGPQNRSIVLLFQA